MHTFEVPRHYGSPEAQIQTDDVLVEIARFTPVETDVHNCLSHHLLMSWIFPRPIVSQLCFDIPGASPRFRDAGDLSFIPAAVPTRSRYRPGSAPYRAVVLRLAPQLFERLGDEAPRHPDAEAMANPNLRDPDIQLGMRQLAREAMAPGFASATLVESITMGLLVRLARHFGKQAGLAPDRGGLAPWQLRRIRERIADANDIDPPPGLAELAALAGISCGHLRRAFKQSTGVTIGDHIRHAQFERAQALLSGTDLPLGEIAIRLGFASQYGFTLAFRRCADETPSAYRKRTRLGSSRKTENKAR